MKTKHVTIIFAILIALNAFQSIYGISQLKLMGLNYNYTGQNILLEDLDNPSYGADVFNDPYNAGAISAKEYFRASGNMPTNCTNLSELNPQIINAYLAWRGFKGNGDVFYDPNQSSCGVVTHVPTPEPTPAPAPIPTPTPEPEPVPEPIPASEPEPKPTPAPAPSVPISPTPVPVPEPIKNLISEPIQGPEAVKNLLMLMTAQRLSESQPNKPMSPEEMIAELKSAGLQEICQHDYNGAVVFQAQVASQNVCGADLPMSGSTCGLHSYKNAIGFMQLLNSLDRARSCDNRDSNSICTELKQEINRYKNLITTLFQDDVEDPTARLLQYISSKIYGGRSLGDTADYYKLKKVSISDIEQEYPRLKTGLFSEDKQYVIDHIADIADGYNMVALDKKTAQPDKFFDINFVDKSQFTLITAEDAATADYQDQLPNEKIQKQIALFQENAYYRHYFMLNLNVESKTGYLNKSRSFYNDNNHGILVVVEKRGGKPLFIVADSNNDPTDHNPNYPSPCTNEVITDFIKLFDKPIEKRDELSEQANKESHYNIIQHAGSVNNLPMTAATKNSPSIEGLIEFYEDSTKLKDWDNSLSALNSLKYWSRNQNINGFSAEEIATKIKDVQEHASDDYALFEAVVRGDDKKIVRLLEKGTANPKAIAYKGMSSLDYAEKYNSKYPFSHDIGKYKAIKNALNEDPETRRIGLYSLKNRYYW